MRTDWKAVLGVLALLVLAAPARAADRPLFDLFTGICAAHPMDLKASLDAASAIGFAPVYPGSFEDQVKADGGMPLQRIAAGGKQVVVLGQGQDPARAGVPKSDVWVCTVGASGEDQPSLDAVGFWVGTPQTDSPGGMVVFGFRDDPAGRTPAADKDPAAVKAALDAGQFRMLVILKSPGGTSLILQSARTAR
jgi:hypothetical protein